MKVNVEKIKNSQLNITVTVENQYVKDTYNRVLDQAVKETEVPGFRKGQAPKEKVEQKLGVSALYGDVINQLLQLYYPQALKEHHIMPISNPKVEIKEFEMEKDFEFVATVAMKPEIKLKDYRSELKKYYENKNKEVKKEIAEKLKKGEDISHSHAHLHPSDVVEVLINSSTFDVPDILIEEELNRLIARMVDQVLAAGMKTEDYLKAQGITMEQLKESYTKIAEQNIRGELVLSEVIKEEKVEVKDEEIDKAFEGVEEEATKEQLKDPMQRLYIRAILEKNKIIESLIKETEGENHHDK